MQTPMSAHGSALGPRRRPWGSERACRPGLRHRRGRRLPPQARPRPRHRRRHLLRSVQPHWRHASACRAVPGALRWIRAMLCLAFCQLLSATPCPPPEHTCPPCSPPATTWVEYAAPPCTVCRCLLSHAAAMESPAEHDCRKASGWTRHTSTHLKGQSVPHTLIMQDLRTVPHAALAGWH